ncbi:hypothetical protein SDC9_130346 [bioreactor metagenome]|uniref:Uncharacterized protein n=1 Tax=bioreactor metagenome TaxID=1076179 RepID=A0A645D2D9_9ZZZZ
MNQRAVPAVALALLMATGLAACGGSSSDDNGPTVSVPAPSAAGVYAVSVASGDAVQAGKYYLAADGQALVVLNDGGEKAAQVYAREAGENQRWVASPAVVSDTTLKFSTTTALTATAAALQSAAGSYVVLLSDQSRATFTVDASGKVTAGSSSGSCKISGQLGKASIARALSAKLATAGCAGLPAAIDGYALLDDDYAPAKLRIVNADGGALADLWAFAI